MTARRWSGQPPEARVERLNRVMTGWANDFSLRQVSPAYSAIDRHAVRRLRRWLCLKHKVKTGKCGRFGAQAAVGDDAVDMDMLPQSLPHVCSTMVMPGSPPSHRGLRPNSRSVWDAALKSSR